MSAPVCDVCGTTVLAIVCGPRPSTPESLAAINSILLELHKRLAGCDTAPKTADGHPLTSAGRDPRDPMNPWPRT